MEIVPWPLISSVTLTPTGGPSRTCGAEARSALERRRAALEPSGPRAPELLHWAAAGPPWVSLRQVRWPLSSTIEAAAPDSSFGERRLRAGRGPR